MQRSNTILSNMDKDNNVENQTQAKAFFLPVLLDRVNRHVQCEQRGAASVDEALAIAFLLEKRWEGQSIDQFMQDVLHVQEGMPSQDAAWSISQIVVATVNEELNRQKIQDPNQSLRIEAQQRLLMGAHANVETSYKNGGKVPLGAVPPSWVPAWAKQALAPMARPSATPPQAAK